jgi:histidine triad (HIT) family protein
MSSIFTKIIQGDIPSYKIAENEFCYAFLDIFPLQKGHVLVVPKKEVDLIFDLEDSDYQELMSFSKKIAKAIKKAIPCERVGMNVIGLEVPHAHVHLIPINNVNDINFANEKLKFSNEEFKSIAEQISNNL